MISDPKHGWCIFDLMDFRGIPSYLTDVPVVLLEAFIDLFTKGQGMACFDEEETKFTLVLTPYSMFIIEEKDKPGLHDCSEINPRELAKELIEDIKKDMYGWSWFIPSNDSEEIQIHRDNIRRLIIELKKHVKMKAILSKREYEEYLELKKKNTLMRKINSRCPVCNVDYDNYDYCPNCGQKLSMNGE